MMRRKHFIVTGNVAILACKIVTLFDCLFPFCHPSAVSWFRCMLPLIRSRGGELICNHGRSAIVRTKEKSISSILGFFHIAWISFKAITAKITSNFYLFDSASNVGTPFGAIDIFKRAFTNSLCKFFPAMAAREFFFVLLAFHRTVYIPPNVRRGPLNLFVTSNAVDSNFFSLVHTATFLRTKTFLGIHVPITIFFFRNCFPAYFTLFHSLRVMGNSFAFRAFRRTQGGAKFSTQIRL